MRIFLIIVTVLAIAASAAYAYYLVFHFPNLNENREEVSEFQMAVSSAVDARDAGDSNRVVSELESYLESASDTERGTAIRLTAESLYATFDNEKRNRAIDLLKTHLIDESISLGQRALTIDLLFSIYYKEQSSEVYEEIFKGPPFATLIEAGEGRRDNVKRVLESMWEIYPTSRNALRLGLWYGNELLTSETLDSEIRDEYRRESRYYLMEAERLYNLRANPNLTFNEFDAIFLNRYGLLAGLLAVDDLTYKTTFEETFKLVENSISINGENAVLQGVLPFTFFYHSVLLDLVYGETREEEMQELVRNFMQAVESNSDAREGFIHFMQNVAALSSEERDYNYDFIIHLSKRSPEFKQFLLQNGFPL